MSDTTILVPGNLGSALANFAGLATELIWINPVSLAFHGFRKLQIRPDGTGLPGVQIRADGVIEALYGVLGISLRLHGLTVHDFAFDWRQKIDWCASNLAGEIFSATADGKPSVVSHSLGCSVARRAIWMLAQIHGQQWCVDKIGKCVFIAPAFHGCFVAALGLMASTKGIPLIGMFPQPGPAAQIVTRSFRSLYELLPWEPFVFDSLNHNNVADPSWWGDKIEAPLMSLVGSQADHAIPWFSDNMAVIIGDSKDEVCGGVEWDKNGNIQPDNSVVSGDGFVPRISSLLPGVKTYLVANAGHLQLPHNHNVISAIAALIKGQPVTSLPAW